MHKAGVVHLNCWQLVICDLHACVICWCKMIMCMGGGAHADTHLKHMKTPETTTSLDAMMSEGMLLADISNQHLVLKAEHASKVSQG
jgi:hypothetical protein